MILPLIHELTAENAAQTIAQVPGLIIIDFYAEWCAPCKTLKPIFEEVAQEFKDKYVFARINIDNCQSIAAQLQITSIPTIAIFDGGQELDRITGLVSKDTLIKHIEQAAQGPQDLSQLPQETLNNKLIQAIQGRLPLEKITQIINAGGQVNFAMANGMTPLLLAIIINANSAIDGSELIKLLLSHGATPEFVDQGGKKIDAHDFVIMMSQNHRKIAETYDTLISIFKEYNSKSQ